MSRRAETAKPCGSRWIDLGHLGQTQLSLEPCTCRSRVECPDCGEHHVFVGCCEPCSIAGREGVPWAELQEAS